MVAVSIRGGRLGFSESRIYFLNYFLNVFEIGLCTEALNGQRF
jgi:hypothetical protein